MTTPLHAIQVRIACAIAEAARTRRPGEVDQIDEVEVVYLGDGDRDPQDGVVQLGAGFLNGARVVRYVSPHLLSVGGLMDVDRQALEAPFLNQHGNWSVLKCQNWLAKHKIDCDAT